MPNQQFDEAVTTMQNFIQNEVVDCWKKYVNRIKVLKPG